MSRLALSIVRRVERTSARWRRCDVVPVDWPKYAVHEPTATLSVKGKCCSPPARMGDGSSRLATSARRPRKQLHPPFGSHS